MDLRQWLRVIRDPYHEDSWLALLLRNLDPGREFLFRCFQGEIPSAQKKLDGGLGVEG
jgi:hypothetical protein